MTPVVKRRSLKKKKPTRQENDKRVIILGVPGVRKTSAANKIAAELKLTGVPCTVINFEDAFLYGTLANDKASFLSSPLEVQHKRWTDAWAKCKNRLPKTGNFILTMHGCFISSLFGARSLLDPGQVARDVNPTLVITLISDIYDCWSETHGGAKGLSIRGDPSLTQLLVARRLELIIGDQIALASPVSAKLTNGHRSYKPLRIKNLLLSVYHPIKTFVHAIACGPQLKIGYLSFPISQPREMEAIGDKSGMEEVSAFVRKAFEIQERHSDLVLLCPLAIDELPFKSWLDSVANPANGATAVFDRAKFRWPLKSLHGELKPLMDPIAQLESMNLQEAHEATSLIKNDVTLRDYRLVDQADFTAVFNPILAGNRKDIAKSVAEEIKRSQILQIPVFLFQDIKRDPERNTLRELGIHPEMIPTMAREPSRDLLISCNDINDLYQHLENGGRIQ
ncbi:hypothetical protein [Roseateles toxinivorans]|uniref:Uncharacterized protein n=1 Tax=Roseateles toxinivorans TaxID=270368 RepID=A0A4R6QCX2_9BURK|nr:hypothetical protein [Roseateles toxinivorans]TDP60644.1 hypothetical protein DES47_11566 [Roseateles toxinivorans]